MKSTMWTTCAILLMLFFWVEDFMTKWRAAHELRKNINKKFSEEEIEIGVPQRVIQIHESTKKG